MSKALRACAVALHGTDHRLVLLYIIIHYVKLHIHVYTDFVRNESRIGSQQDGSVHDIHSWDAISAHLNHDSYSATKMGLNCIENMNKLVPGKLTRRPTDHQVGHVY